MDYLNSPSNVSQTKGGFPNGWYHVIPARSHVIRKREANWFGLACRSNPKCTTEFAAFVGFEGTHVTSPHYLFIPLGFTRFGFRWYLTRAIIIGVSSFIRSDLPLRYRHKRLAVAEIPS